MYLCGIIALAGILAITTCKADGGEPQSPDITAKQLRKTDCTKLAVTALNKLKDFKACSGLTAECMGKFDVTNLSPACLDEINGEEWKKFGAQTVTQLIQSDVAEISLNKVQLKAILDKLDLKALPASFSAYVVRNNALLGTIFDTDNAETIATFLAGGNLSAMDLPFFRRLGPKVIAALPNEAFQSIRAEQLYLIPKESFEAFTNAQFAQIPPAALIKLVKAQANGLPISVWNALTPEQVKSFGADPRAIPKVFSKESATRNSEVLTRRHYLEVHPCRAYADQKSKIDTEKQKLLDERCSDVLAARVNSSSRVVVSTLMTTGAFLLAAALPAMFA